MSLYKLTSDLLVRDEHLGWRTALDADALKALLGDDVQLGKSIQDSVMVHGFNGTSRLWRMPAAAIRREAAGAGVAKLAERAAKNERLDERTHESFGGFRVDAALPAVTSEVGMIRAPTPVIDIAEKAIARTTQKRFGQHDSLAMPDKMDENGQRPPSLSQWRDLVGGLEANNQNALTSRLDPTTAADKSWKRKDAKAIVDELNKVLAAQRKLYARLVVRGLRATSRASQTESAR